MVEGVTQALSLMLQAIVGLRTVSIYMIWLNLCVLISVIMYFVSKLINDEIDYQNYAEGRDHKREWRKRYRERGKKD